ncbi:helix-turn-helix domain-containing protein [Streptomyces sp. NPDC005962]|uniref:helix-turn-helix domain-containing protein n=1 Tax=Streptomyces sp. NPDC005962 TaxID=3154466 RepID=UPI0033D4CA17
MSSEFIGVAAAAAYLDVSERWMYRQSLRYGIPRYRFGGKVKFKVVDLDRWARQQRIS